MADKDKTVKCRVQVLALCINVIDGKETAPTIKDGVYMAPGESITYQEGDVFDCPESIARKLEKGGSVRILVDGVVTQPAPQVSTMSQSAPTNKSTIVPAAGTKK